MPFAWCQLPSPKYGSYPSKYHGPKNGKWGPLLFNGSWKVFWEINVADLNILCLYF